MIKVAILTEEQKNELIGEFVSPGVYFNPVKDADDNWVISENEINASNIEWLKELPLINFNANIISFE